MLDYRKSLFRLCVYCAESASGTRKRITSFPGTEVQFLGQRRVEAGNLFLLILIPIGAADPHRYGPVSFRQEIIDGGCCQLVALFDHIAKLLNQPAAGLVAERVVA